LLPLGIAALAAFVGLRFGLPLWRTHRANIRGLAHPLPVIPAATASDRLLVLAPHCDDESLACGGLIAQAVKAGARVHVVLLTNGDGFHYAAERLFGEIEVPPADYLKLARDRQRESLSALSTLGLPRHSVTFLGYPDGGTARMWLSYWEPNRPYTSRQTKDDHNPYSNSLRPGAPYCGRAVVEDLKTVIRDFRPTTIFCPHPNDEHPDHWALHCYALAALHELGMLHNVPMMLYLVHRGDWPVPQGFHPSVPMAPPAALAALGTRWESLPLDEALAKRKRQAILKYRSQLVVMRRFLMSFGRSSELFGLVQLGHLPTAASGRIRVDGGLRDWNGVAPVIRDPAKDVGQADISAAADLISVRALRDSRRLFLRVDLRGRASPGLRYAVRIHALSPRGVGPPRSYLLSPRHARPDVDFEAAGRSLEISLPLPRASPLAGVMLCIETHFYTLLLDKTAWVLLEVV
jgi:LmbE family N-acetylglucosaminyl deacetylase